MLPPAADLLARLAALPAGARVLDALEDPAADGAPAGVWLVGGAVRDLALGGTPRELDVVVVPRVGGEDGVAAADHVAALADALADRLGGARRGHAAFGTHAVEGEGVRIDVAMARTETYPRPGALPVVQATHDVDEDLLRRDFTVNAIALGVSVDVRGDLAAAPQAGDDLAAGRLRVLHERSFVDDPTRLLRLVRYAARLDFAIEAQTERLAREAFAARAPATAGVARIGTELLLLVGEPPDVAIRALVVLRDLAGEAMPAPGLDADATLAGEGGLDPGLDVDAELLARAAALVPADGRVDLVLLAAAVRRVEAARLRAWLTAIHLARADAAWVADAADDPEALAAAMRAAATPSALHRLLRHRAVEAVALAGALGAEEAARRWLDDLRHVRLRVTGSDLARAGVPEGPEVGRRLAAALERKLDEGLATPEEELAAALESR